MPEIEYLWDELCDNVTVEYEDGVLSASYSHEPGLYGNLLRQNRGGVTSYYHFDGRGDTVALTNDAGNITDTKAYDAWGNVIASTGATEIPFRFGGRCGYHTAGEIFSIRERNFSSETARWLSLDPIPLFSRSRYGYSGNRPISFVDPSGLWEQVHIRPEWYKASGSDTFDSLVKLANPLITTANKVCIRPVPAREANGYLNPPFGASDPDPAQWEAQLVTPCAVYDVSNLLPRHIKHPNEFSAAIGYDDNGYISNAATFFTAERFSNGNDPFNAETLFKAFRNRASGGENPITLQYLIGHSWGNQNRIGGVDKFGNSAYFELADIIALQNRLVPGLRDHKMYSWQYDLAQAMEWNFSFPCSFAVDAHVYFVGCITNRLAENFSRTILRRLAIAHGTSQPTAYGFDMNTGALLMGWDLPNATFYSSVDEYLKDGYWDSHNGAV